MVNFFFDSIQIYENLCKFWSELTTKEKEHNPPKTKQPSEYQRVK